MKTHAFSTPAGEEAPLLLDLYRPAGAATPPPVIVFVHGGAFLLGDRAMGADLQACVTQAGFALASIDYRLAPKHVFPANVEDTRTAVRWLRRHAKELGIDGDRIGLWGASAGGYLVAMAGLLPADLYAGGEYPEQSSAVSCVLDGYGPVDLAAGRALLEREGSRLEPVAPGLEALPNRRVEGERQLTPALRDLMSRVEEVYLGAPPHTIPEVVRAANPATYATSAAPPFLLMHGLADSSVAHGHSVMLYEALAAANVEVTLRSVHGLPHTFFNTPGLDEAAGPFRMTVRAHTPGAGGTTSEDTGFVFATALDFFRKHFG